MCFQVLLRKIIELHDKYMAYVSDCFVNNSQFHKVCAVQYRILFIMQDLDLTVIALSKIFISYCTIGP